MPHRLRAPLLTATLLLVLPLGGGCNGGAPPSPPPQAAAEAQGPEAPDFTLDTPDGEPFALADHRGQVVVVNFWATWCLPCVVEIPEFVELQDELRDEGVVFVGVSQDAGPGSFDDVRDFGEMFGVNYPLVMDPGFRVGRLYDGAATLPTTVVVNREGRIHARQRGLLDRERLLAMLEGLVSLPLGHDDALSFEVPVYEPGPGRLGASRSPGGLRPLALSAREAAPLVHEGVMVVDLRPEALRVREGAIPYALALGLEQFDETWLPANLGAPVVFVAADEAEAWAAATRASGWGYARAHPLVGGFAAWRGAGLPVEPPVIAARSGMPQRG